MYANPHLHTLPEWRAVDLNLKGQTTHHKEGEKEKKCGKRKEIKGKQERVHYTPYLNEHPELNSTRGLIWMLILTSLGVCIINYPT